ncbi:MAG: tilS [Burkholderiaceae bacterium]|nr:tilS [Burkholderiaceae bacterium]
MIRRGGEFLYNLSMISLLSDTQIDLKTPTAVAVSGGVDSMCLLRVLSERSRAQGWTLYAFHIHHGLQTQADEWVAVVRTYCAQLGVGFDVRRLDASTREAAQSIEEWARHGRYHALTDMAQAHGIEQIVLAHHQDDQIETYLLQTARGAGARGQSAMPERLVRHGVTWLRPWLHVTRAQIEQYAHAHQIPYIHDPSNDDIRFSRNAIRAQLKHSPLSVERRQDILNHIADAQAQLHAQQTWAQDVLRRHQISHRTEIGECGRLHHVRLCDYAIEQQQVLIREWLAQMGWRMPSRTALAELTKQLQGSELNSNMCWRHSEGGGITKLKKDWIAAQMPPQGQWFMTPELRARIEREQLSIRGRTGGERFRLAPNRPTISLKHAYQMAGVAPMLRAQLPLLYDGERLVHVVGVGDVF